MKIYTTNLKQCCTTSLNQYCTRAEVTYFFKNLKNNHVENNQYCTISKKNYVNVIRPLPRYLITIGTLVGVNFMGRL